MKEDTPLLEVRNLATHFTVKHGVVRAVDDVSFSVRRGSIVGLVGESGSGKTTLGRSVLRLVEPKAGELAYNGVDLLNLSSKEMQKYREKLQIIFQDPFSSLNPRMRVGAIIGEGLTNGRSLSRADRQRRIGDLLERVGLAREHSERFPHEFSGGQRQRIGIARALAVEPEFIVADEPVSALDVSVQAQILTLMQELQDELQLTLLFISHDLGVVKYLCDEIIVMYLGRIVERGPSRLVYNWPAHPYTQALISAAPTFQRSHSSKRVVLSGDIPSPLSPPSGCVFRTRCPFAKDVCAEVTPPEEVVHPGHSSACIRRKELEREGHLPSKNS